MPKVSVLMSVYNTEENFLREAIKSILNQTYKDFEFLIINDGSTKNNTEQVILSFKDDRIRYIPNERNMGIIASCNKGFDLANGEYIARFDSDDIALPQRLEKEVEFLDKNPDYGLVGSYFETFPKKRIVKGFTDYKKVREALLVNSNQFGQSTVMIRTSVLNSNNITRMHCTLKITTCGWIYQK